MSRLDRDALADRVRRRLLEDGASPEVVELVLRPGFFPSGDAGLVEFARKLGVRTDHARRRG